MTCSISCGMKIAPGSVSISLHSQPEHFDCQSDPAERVRNLLLARCKLRHYLICFPLTTADASPALRDQHDRWSYFWPCQNDNLRWRSVLQFVFGSLFPTCFQQLLRFAPVRFWLSM